MKKLKFSSIMNLENVGVGVNQLAILLKIYI